MRVGSRGAKAGGVPVCTVFVPLGTARSLVDNFGLRLGAASGDIWSWHGNLDPTPVNTINVC